MIANSPGKKSPKGPIRSGHRQASPALLLLLILAAAIWPKTGPLQGAPLPPRHFHTAVWTGTDMIVWGGSNPNGYLKDGLRYNPSSNNWNAISDSGLLAPRDSHTAIWTGQEMIIWGGSGGILFTNGARYNPSGNSWTATTLSSTPVLRQLHTAIWSGSDMIVWGGAGNTGMLNTGGRYNPVANAWTATPATSTPGRYYHTATWTGNEMIVWGGYNSGYLDSGGRYNPTTGFWTATSTTGAPVPRYWHTSIWTGNELIIWGGNNGSPLNTGGRYNLTANTWTATPTAGAPVVRSFHTAVWTGTEMIVWGGFTSGSAALNTGGRYNPSNNSWTPVNTIGAPSARFYHTAAWTGTEMIIYGGYGLNDGGRYNPVTDTWTALPTSTACVPGFPDDFVCREILSGTNVSFYASNASATIESGEPSHFFEPNNIPASTKIPEAGSSLWYSWTAPFSGGVVVTAASTNTDFTTPCLAAYTGSALANLTQIATNHASYGLSRVAFNVAQGSNYLFAVAGTTAFGSTGTGGMNLNLAFTPTPANDHFTNRVLVPALFYETSGSFVGASREAGEPAHTNSLDFASWPQTLWWTWTAPSDLGVGAVPVKLTADGLGFIPNIGVYTGSSVSNLTNVAVSAQSGGLSSRAVSFLALPGATYQIVLGGPQHDPKIGSLQFAQFRFRLNVRALVLSSSNIDMTNNADYTRSFGTSLQVTNLGSADSAPLRVQVTAILGNILAAGPIPPSNGQVLLLTTNLPALSPGQGLARRIGAVVPAPTDDANTNETGYSVYADLQEQVATNWSTLDNTFLLVGALTTSVGTGGGVIRLDAGLSGQAFNPLTNVSILGPLSANEGTVPAYYGRARYASGLQQNFTNTVWTSTRFSITNGLLKTGSVISNTPVGITARYSSGGFIYNSATNVLVLNLPPPTLSAPTSFAGTFGLRLDGVAGRKHVIESANALSNLTLWLPLSTNSLDPNGLWNFSIPIGINPQLFFRAREAE